MTTVYGVTYIGARDQIEKQLREKSIVAPDQRWSVAGYLAKEVRHNHSPVFPSLNTVNLDSCSYW